MFDKGVRARVRERVYSRVLGCVLVPCVHACVSVSLCACAYVRIAGRRKRIITMLVRGGALEASPVPE